MLAYYPHNLTRIGGPFCAFGRNLEFAENIWENFRKFSKVFLRKLGKCICLADLSQNWTLHSWLFRAFTGSRQSIGNYEKFFDNFEKLKNAKIHYFSAFYIRFNLPCLTSLLLSKKGLFLGNSEQILENFENLSSENW